MTNSYVRLAGDHLWEIAVHLAVLVMSIMVSFVLSFFQRDVLDEILDLIESVSGGLPTYPFNYVELRS